mmetsp:Transcript_807/g.2181  ORF Transcript_807/g.2181 Transcript_807/m.2181 type:complete len:308 (-) Transcript_807:489-1412(-)
MVDLLELLLWILEAGLGGWPLSVSEGLGGRSKASSCMLLCPGTGVETVTEGSSSPMHLRCRIHRRRLAPHSGLGSFEPAGTSLPSPDLSSIGPNSAAYNQPSPSTIVLSIIQWPTHFQPVGRRPARASKSSRSDDEKDPFLFAQRLSEPAGAFHSPSASALSSCSKISSKMTSWPTDISKLPDLRRATGDTSMVEGARESLPAATLLLKEEGEMGAAATWACGLAKSLAFSLLSTRRHPKSDSIFALSVESPPRTSLAFPSMRTSLIFNEWMRVRDHLLLRMNCFIFFLPDPGGGGKSLRLEKAITP